MRRIPHGAPDPIEQLVEIENRLAVWAGAFILTCAFEQRPWWRPLQKTRRHFDALVEAGALETRGRGR